MKIAYIVEPRKVIGGGVRAAINLAKAMNQFYGETAEIFGVYKGSVKDESVRFIEVDMLKPMSLHYYNALKNYLRNSNPDVVHCLGLYSALLLVALKRKTKATYRIVCTVHRVTMNMRFRSLMKFVLPYIVRNVSYVTFLTNYQKRHYFENVGFRPENNAVIPNVIFVEQHTRDEISTKKRELQKKVGAGNLTCYVGRIIPSKNIEDTIRLIGILNRRGVNVGCILVGGYEKEYYERLQRIIAEENVGDKIHFEGYVNNPTLYIAASTTITTTTHGEALPNLMVETFALGKALFSSDIPQMVDLIDNGRNGYTCSLNDLEMFADIMEKVYADEALRNRVEREAVRTYGQRTTINNQLIQISAI